MYADLVRGIAKDSVEELYPEGDGIWQDDGARIHRCPQALHKQYLILSMTGLTMKPKHPEWLIYGLLKIYGR